MHTLSAPRTQIFINKNALSSVSSVFCTAQFHSSVVVVVVVVVVLCRRPLSSALMKWTIAAMFVTVLLYIDIVEEQ
jgi:hypothetical protein